MVTWHYVAAGIYIVGLFPAGAIVAYSMGDDDATGSSFFWMIGTAVWPFSLPIAVMVWVLSTLIEKVGCSLMDVRKILSSLVERVLKR